MTNWQFSEDSEGRLRISMTPPATADSPRLERLAKHLTQEINGDIVRLDALIFDAKLNQANPASTFMGNFGELISADNIELLETYRQYLLSQSANSQTNYTPPDQHKLGELHKLALAVSRANGSQALRAGLHLFTNPEQSRLQDMDADQRYGYLADYMARSGFIYEKGNQSRLPLEEVQRNEAVEHVTEFITQDMVMHSVPDASELAQAAEYARQLVELMSPEAFFYMADYKAGHYNIHTTYTFESGIVAMDEQKLVFVWFVAED
jgi:hypothetical protein